ncbi:MAG: MTH938/NDUFAF3 family protein [Hyphomicrobiaceae bacterium]|nr:MTH938/NDUFAF3 family protein [Hyphomicrobiaceae bacterium]
MSSAQARYPYQAPIDAYGNGGFRFADMSHRGSILCLPSGIHAWPVAAPEEVTPRSLARVLDGAPIGFLLLGTGPRQVFPSRALKDAFAAAGIGLEPMDTGAAARTYNVLLAERRSVGAALIAVD